MASSLPSSALCRQVTVSSSAAWLRAPPGDVSSPGAMRLAIDSNAARTRATLADSSSACEAEAARAAASGVAAGARFTPSVPPAPSELPAGGSACKAPSNG